MPPVNWDNHYSSQNSSTAEPSTFLKKNIDRLPPGQALDLATGSGRNAIFLARNSYQVHALDLSLEAVKKLSKIAKEKSLQINAQQVDLSSFQIPEGTYDVIINFNFLERSLFPHIQEGLKKGGMLLFETYTSEQVHYGRPRNPEYLLRPNELIKVFMNLHIIYYHERVIKSAKGTKAIASLLAQKR